MPTLIYCKDATGAAELRKTHMAAHLEYIETIIDEICVAGPVRKEAGGDVAGSCLIFRTDDQAAARELFSNDPYYKAGIFDSVEISHMAAAAGNWVGGKTW